MKHKFLSLTLFMITILTMATNTYGPLAAQTAWAQATPPPPAGISTAGSLQDQIDASNQQITTLNQQIAQYQSELQQIGSDKRTLQAAIKSLDLQRSTVEAQITITQRQMAITQLQVQQLGGEITDTQQAIMNDQNSLGAYIRDLQKNENIPLLIQVLSSSDITQAWTDLNANLQMQEYAQNEMQALQVQEKSLANAKANSQAKQQVLTSQQKSLATQQKTLAQTVQSKNQLLADTNAKESTYQQLLAAAEAELNSFSAFVQNAGGSKLLANQTNCDAWGCYYSQRDSAWGAQALNGTRYTLASDGCLITSMAMVLTHYGLRDVTPATINGNPANFASYYPAYLLYTIVVDGVTATRKTASLDATLATGNPVIVGLRAYGGTHFVVLVSGARGHYIMRDPYVAGGKDISFTDRYAVRSIFSIAKVVVGS